MIPTIRVAVLAFVLGAPAVSAAADGGATCATSAECATPRPHCQPTLHQCVECLGDRNCASGKVCKIDEGVCAECRSDSDCSVLRPYCVSASGQCVECVTTANCGDPGVVCQSGKCGSCGDGVCGSREVLGNFGFQPGPVTDDGFRTCPEDCASLCPSKDVGSGLGVFSISTAGLRNVFIGSCIVGAGDGVDAFFKWTAPSAGSFLFATPNANTSLAQFEDGCGGFPTSCASGGEGFAFPVAVTAGQEVVFLLEAQEPVPDTLQLEISVAPPPGCDSSQCMEPDAGKTGSALCLANAEDRGDPKCSGVECACNHCPRDYDDCHVIPGCDRIAECMREKNCVGVDCYNSGACRGIIDTYDGISGPAFRASSGLTSCSLSFECGLPCEVPDSGAPDAGQLCTPNGSVACTCGDKSGTKRCAADGMAFDVCNCPAAPAAEDDDGCGCRLAGATGSQALGAGLGLLLALGAVSRRRRKFTGSNLIGRVG